MMEGTIYGYARCSTDADKQDISRQIRELKALGVTDEKHIFYEYASGTQHERIELQKLMNTVTAGDTIAVTEVSRLSRSTKQLCEIIQAVQEKKLRLMIGSFVVDCRNDSIDPMTKGMVMMWSVFSELERDIISQRVKSGMNNAKEKGKKIGRPQTTRDSIPESFWKYYAMYHNTPLNVTDLSRLMGCSRTTVYKYISIAEGCHESTERM